MLIGRPDNKYAARRNRIARHNLNKGAGIQTAFDEIIRKPSDAEPRHRLAGAFSLQAAIVSRGLPEAFAKTPC